MPRSGPRCFFKVFFPDQSSNFLRIPRAFWEHIEAERGKAVSLKGPSGGIWKVNLVKNSEGFIFEDGWKRFVADQCLVVGDFLLFRYGGNSRFKVLVFDSSACEKKKSFLARPSVEEENEVVEESEESEEDVSIEDDEEEENKPLAHFAKRRLEWILKKKRGINDLLAVKDSSKKKMKKQKRLFQFNMDESNSKNLKPSAALHIPNSRDLVTVKQECESYSPSDSIDYNRGMPIVKNEEAMIRNSSISIRCRMLHKLYKNVQGSGPIPYSSKTSTSKKVSSAMELVKSNENVCRRGSIFRVGSLISQRRPVTEEEVGKTLERAMLFKSEHPFAIAVMQDSYVYTSFFMCVPSWFAKEYLPKENTVLTVWDPAGKPWKITYISYNTHGALSGGWGKFSYAHNLEKFDVCVFELIQENQLKAHIYRVVEETKPLIRRRRDSFS